MRAFIWLLSFYLAVAPAVASQNALLSPTTGTVSGLQLTNNYNNALDSVNTCNSGTSAPTNQLSGVPSLGNCWLNSTSIPYPVQFYDGAQWVTPFWIDATNHVTDVKIGGGTVSLASASTVDLCNASNSPNAAYVTITGTTTITSFGSTCKAGHVKFLTFAGALTLTYNATSLIVPGAANVITSAGDQAVLICLGSGNWQVAMYQPASGQALLNPAIDVGDYVMTALTAPPSSKYLFGYGEAISRTTYAALLTDITITQSVTATNGSPTLTGFSDTTQIATGAKVEASYFSAPTTVVSCTSTTCTMAANATASTTGNVTIFPYGDGDGSTTFNLPDCRGAVFAGRDNMGGTAKGTLTSANYGTNPDALGAAGGAQTRTIAQANLPNVNFSVSGITLSNGGIFCNNTTSSCSPGTNNAEALMYAGATSNQQSAVPNSTAGSITGPVLNVTVSAQGSAASGGSGTALATIQPTITANCMIRVLSFLTPLHGVPMPPATNDDQFAAVEPRRSAA